MIYLEYLFGFLTAVCAAYLLAYALRRRYGADLCGSLANILLAPLAVGCALITYYGFNEWHFYPAVLFSLMLPIFIAGLSGERPFFHSLKTTLVFGLVLLLVFSALAINEVVRTNGHPKSEAGQLIVVFLYFGLVTIICTVFCSLASSLVSGTILFCLWRFGKTGAEETP